MNDYQRFIRRQSEIKQRAKTPNHMYGYCRIIGCGKPARAGTNDGLDKKYCRSHYEHFQRHGSVVKGSYTARDVNPYRHAALEWLLANTDDVWVTDAIGRVRGLYQRSGRNIEAFRLRGLSPSDRAKAAWARLRHHGIDPLLVIASWVAIELVVKDDPQPVLTSEFKQVQGAKLIHKMASGTHKKWDIQNSTSAMTRTTELHVYPRPRGRVLRHIGRQLAETSELLVDHRIGDISTFVQKRFNEQGRPSRPWPKGWSARRRKDD
ncbi:hypothetical protein [Thalassospira povalilytica]|uniref:Uncharacterized protein n=1 Tax=Thalassospira povalilytica TaxID=732237 RepID=A0A8I1M5M7_9PROT|nr:hypothetical protein [Thalassospira povalilytica]MBN8195319.1 hypothetical protein [Thalassospira povalilytica]